MDLNPSEEQQQLIEAFGALYAKESSSERVRAAEPVGHDPDLWQRLRDNGALEMSVDEQAGGSGASLLDLALVAEQHGRFLGSAPMLEAQATARLLARVESPEAKSALVAALAGDRLTTLALHPPRNGVLTMVPSGAVADTVVYFDGNRLWSAESQERRRVANLGSLPVADIAVGTDARLLGSGPEVGTLFDLARDEWLVLMANALAGIATRSLELGVAYVKERHAFGVPVGSFQAVAHGLADAATRVDGGGLLAREAAWAAAEEPDRASELAALACAFNAEAAREASYRSLHYHGGYGFMLEYDIQLYFRRAKAWPALFAEPAALYARAEGHRLSARSAGPPSVHPAPGSPTMDFRLGEGSEAFRQEARTFLDEVLTDEVRDQMHRTGVHHNWDFHRHLVERGLTGPRMARGVRRPGSGSPRDAGLHGGVPPGRSSDLRGGDHPDGGQHHPAPRHRGAEAAHSPSGAGWGDHHRARVHRAGVGLRRGRRPDPGGPGRRSVGSERAEDVHYQRPGGRLRLHADPDQSRCSQAPGTDHLPGAPAAARCGDPAGVHAVGRADQPHLLLRCPGG